MAATELIFTILPPPQRRIIGTAAGTCVVYEDIYPAEFFVYLFEDLRDRRFVGNVGAEIAYALIAARVAADAADGIPLFGKHGGDRRAYASGAAAYNRYLFPAHFSRPCSSITRCIISAASSMSASVWLAIRLVRMRHSFGAQAGGRTDLT